MYQQPDETIFMFTFITRNKGENDDYPTHVIHVEASNLSEAIATIEDDDLEILHIFEGEHDDLVAD
jgi:hypothetical protein